LRFALSPRGGARPQRQHFVFHQLAGLDVEGRKGLVHQDDVGVEHQGLCQAGALAHAAAELVGIAVAKATEADAAQPVFGLRTGIWLGDATELQARHHVLQGGAPGHQALGLKHVAGAGVDVVQRLTKNMDRALARREQAGRHIEQRALAATRGPDHAHELTRSYGEIHVFDSGVTLAWVVLADEGAGHVAEFDGGFHVVFGESVVRWAAGTGGCGRDCPFVEELSPCATLEMAVAVKRKSTAFGAFIATENAADPA
jgi:hypothetical protein